MRFLGLVIFLAVAGCNPTASLKLGGKLKLGKTAFKLTRKTQVRVTLDSWTRLSSATAGVTLAASGSGNLVAVILDVLQRAIPAGEPVDLVFVVDTTGSMRDDIDAMIGEMHRILADLRARNPDHRVGFVVYRDRGDPYIAQTALVLTRDEAAIQQTIASLVVDGGGDVPEHVYAGLYTALVEQPWRPGVSQHIVLMGDAPPHEDYHDDPRNYDSVVSLATSAPLRVQIHGVGIRCPGCD